MGKGHPGRYCSCAKLTAINLAKPRWRLLISKWMNLQCLLMTATCVLHRGTASKAGTCFRPQAHALRPGKGVSVTRGGNPRFLMKSWWCSCWWLSSSCSAQLVMGIASSSAHKPTVNINHQPINFRWWLPISHQLKMFRLICQDDDSQLWLPTR